MAILTMQWGSQSLGKCTKANIYVNDAARPPYPVYYLLHGLSDDETMWLRKTQLEDHAAPWPFLIVMPDGERSFYCDVPTGAFEQLIAKELVGRIDGLFPTRAEARYRAVGGLSMGGYGAVKLALKYPGVFSVGVSHSGAVGMGASDTQRLRMEELRALVGSALDDPANHCHRLAERLPRRGRPALALDCGVDDFLFEDNQAFHAHLEKIGYPHVYRTMPGNHHWPYWNARLPEALAFAAAKMRLKRLS